MAKIDAPAKLIRTTLGCFLAGQDDVDACVYVIACCPWPGVLYVGKTNHEGIRHRLRQHLNETKYSERIGGFIRSCFADACGWRLDILLPPAGLEVGSADVNRWLKDAEHALIKKFDPMFNTRP